MIFVAYLFFMLFSLNENFLDAASNGSSAEIDPAPKMVFISGGTFSMGCMAPADADCYKDEKPAHTVVVPDFYIGRYEVTNAEYCRFLNDPDIRKLDGKEWIDLESGNTLTQEKCRIVKSGDTFRVQEGFENYPVIFVSWKGAVAYCEWLSRRKGKIYRLPTEAEWEFAARGGTRSKSYLFSGSDQLETVAWCKENSGGKLHPVGEKQANEIGLFDMSGNAWEWCADDWHDNYQGAPADGSAWLKQPNRADFRVLRGGFYNGNDKTSRVTVRWGHIPSGKMAGTSFRLAREN